MKKLFLFFIAAGLLLSSCKKDIAGSLPWTAYSDASYSQVFEAFWTGMNTNYVWWSQDSVNWDEKYAVYKPLFDNLNIDSPSDQRKSIGYFEGMTEGLIDSHYYISFAYSILKGIKINPAGIRKNGKIDTPIRYTFFADTLFCELDPDTRIWDSLTFQNNTEEPGKSSPQQLLLIAGTIDQSYIYFHLNAFYVYMNRNNPAVQSFMAKFRALLSDSTSGYKGLIFDLRSNPGGMISDLNYVAGNLIDSAYTFGYTRQKSGPNRLDYTPCMPAIFASSGFGLRTLQDLSYC